jgi:hypothetical protein
MSVNPFLSFKYLSLDYLISQTMGSVENVVSSIGQNIFFLLRRLTKGLAHGFAVRSIRLLFRPRSGALCSTLHLKWA